MFCAKLPNFTDWKLILKRGETRNPPRFFTNYLWEVTSKSYQPKSPPLPSKGCWTTSQRKASGGSGKELGKVTTFEKLLD